MKTQYLLLFFVFVCSLAANAQDKKGKASIPKDVERYSYDTLLSQGYHLAYRVYLDSVAEEGLQSLTLVKGKRDIRQLNEISYPLPQKNLGYIGADFGDSFLFVQSYGAGNPHEMQLIEKKTGKELMQGVWVDVHQAEKVVLYVANINEENEALILLDLKSGKRTVISHFQDTACEKERISGLRDCVKIAFVTAKEIMLQIDYETEKISKKYKR
jgi:hypothetical protein